MRREMRALRTWGGGEGRGGGQDGTNLIFTAGPSRVRRPSGISWTSGCEGR